MSYIFTNVQVTVATSDVQSILEIPVTDEIHVPHGESKPWS